MKSNKILFILALFLAVSCKETSVPKPKAYPRIEFPEKKYQIYNSDCPYTFEYPVYASIEKDQSLEAQPCWFNILYKPYNARLHLSYKEITNPKELYGYIEDAYNLAYKHTVKADAITEKLIKTNNRVYGILYELEGSTATALEFYVTDSTRHYLRGALYFNTRINRDSLDPMINYLKVDINKMINTLRWK
jgi:gliding motility-associated lipoprotein GldD